MAPKALLRHPEARSALGEMAAGTRFQPVVEDEELLLVEGGEVAAPAGARFRRLVARYARTAPNEALRGWASERTRASISAYVYRSSS